MLRIDTLKFARSLSDAGMDQRQAEALVRGLSDADTSDFATKADVGEVRTEVSALRADMAELRTELKGDIADLRGEMFRFMYLQAMGIVGLTTGLTVTLMKLLP